VSVKKFVICGHVRADSDEQSLEILREEFGCFQFTAGIVITSVNVGDVSEKIE
jgi:hypothetical protein